MVRSTCWPMSSSTCRAMGVHLSIGALVLLISLSTSCGSQESSPGRKRLGSPKSLDTSGREVAAHTQHLHHDGHLHDVVRARDTADTDHQDGAGFPLNDGLPPPGQPLPPLAPNEDTSTAAPSVSITPRPTTSDAALSSASYITLPLTLFLCHFLREVM